MKFLKTMIVLLLVLGVVGGGGVFAMRANRERFTAPRQVKDGIYEISNGGISLFGTKVGAEVVLFDTGADPQGRPVDALLQALGASRQDVRHVFLTHGHGDHTAAATLFPNAQIYLGAADQDLASGKELPGTIVAKLFAKIAPTPPAKATRPLAGRSSAMLTQERVVEALPAGAHTPGSFVYFYDGVLFAGDILVIKQGRLEPTPFLFDPSPDETRKAIRGLKAQLADKEINTVCTSHAGCTPRGLGRTLLNEIVERLGG